MYGDPVYNAEQDEYYALLPDPANENKFHIHVAAIKVRATACQLHYT